MGALRILHINNKRFIIANQKEMRLWDLEKEQTTKLPVEGCDANLIELMANKYLVLADKWIRVIDFTTLQT